MMILTRWYDWVDLVLGVWLFISPWVLAITSNSAGTWNAWLLGAVLSIVALWTLDLPGNPTLKWFSAALGAWTFTAPWALKFVSVKSAAWDDWIVGALVCLIAFLAIGKTQAHSWMPRVR